METYEVRKILNFKRVNRISVKRLSSVWALHELFLLNASSTWATMSKLNQSSHVSWEVHTDSRTNWEGPSRPRRAGLTTCIISCIASGHDIGGCSLIGQVGIYMAARSFIQEHERDQCNAQCMALLKAFRPGALAHCEIYFWISKPVIWSVKIEEIWSSCIRYNWIVICRHVDTVMRSHLEAFFSAVCSDEALQSITSQINRLFMMRLTAHHVYNVFWHC